MIEAVIFDMDGLLVDSEPSWYRARIDVAAGYGKTWTEADQLAMAGVHTDVWVEALYDKLDGQLEREHVFDEIIGRMAGYYEAGEVPILPGAEEALAACAKRYHVGLASGSPMRLIEACLKGAGWGASFEALISSDELEHGKPAPDIYLELIRRMDLEAARTAVVEDSGAGIRSAKAAATVVVAVPNPSTDPGPELLALADARIGSLHELAATLADMD
jgi:HAD superfamily hydrolase (TIGR01509 family)